MIAKVVAERLMPCFYAPQCTTHTQQVDVTADEQWQYLPAITWYIRYKVAAVSSSQPEIRGQDRWYSDVSSKLLNTHTHTPSHNCFHSHILGLSSEAGLYRSNLLCDVQTTLSTTDTFKRCLKFWTLIFSSRPSSSTLTNATHPWLPAAGIQYHYWICTHYKCLHNNNDDDSHH